MHPHIVSCYYVRDIDQKLSVFSEWMDGGSLKDVIVKGSLYEGDKKQILMRILDIAIQFARGLNYAHENGLVHQDVKPANLMLSTDGSAKVSDFGIAKVRSSILHSDTSFAKDETIITNGMAYTPEYCSPEQLCGEKLTRRTDIWSWAVSVVEMFYGNLCWGSGIVFEKDLDKYLDGYAPDKIKPARICPPESVRALLKQCFMEDETERPHDFKAIEERLTVIYREETGMEYTRETPDAAMTTCDSLNNKALSFLDIGKPEETARCWEKALELDPNHAQSVYNSVLYKWRKGEIDNDEAEQLILLNNQVNASNSSKKRLAMFYMECAQFDKAKRLLKNDDDADIYEKLSNRFNKFQPIKETKKVRNYGYYFNNKYFVITIGKNEYYTEIYSINANANQYKLLYKGDFDFDTIDFNRDGSMLLFRSERSLYMQIRNIQKGGPPIYVRTNELDKYYCCFVENDEYVAAITDKGDYYKWKVATQEETSKKIVKARVRTVIFNNDKTRALLIHSRTLCALVDLKNGTVIKELSEIMLNEIAYTFSNDSKYFVALTGEWELNLYSSIDGSLVSTIHAYKNPCYEFSIIFSSHDKFLVYANNDESEIRLWDMESQKHLRPLVGHSENNITGMNLSPDNHYLLSMSYVYNNEKETLNVKAWHIKSGKCIFTRIYENARSASFAQSSDKIIVGYNDYIEFVSLPTNDFQAGFELSRIKSVGQTLEEEKKIKELIVKSNEAYEKNDIQYALDCLYEAIAIPSFSDYKLFSDLNDKLGQHCMIDGCKSIVKLGSVQCLSRETTVSGYSEDASKIYTIDDIYFQVKITDSKTFEVISEVDLSLTGMPEFYLTAQFSKDCSLVMLMKLRKKREKTWTFFNSDNYDCVEVYDTHSGELVYNRNVHPRTRKFTMCPNKKYIVLTDPNAEVRLISLTTNEEQVIMRDNTQGKNYVDITFSSDSKYIAFSTSIRLMIWDIENRSVIFASATAKNIYKHACFSNDSKLLLITGDGDKICLYDIGNKKLKYERSMVKKEGNNQVTSLAFCNSNKYFLSTSKNGYIGLWSIERKKVLFEMRIMYDEKMNVVFSPTGKGFIINSSNNFSVVYYIDWLYRFIGYKDYDDVIEQTLQEFFENNTNYSEMAFENFITEIQKKGYGWIKKEAISRRLEQLKERHAVVKKLHEDYNLAVKEGNIKSAVKIMDMIEMQLGWQGKYALLQMNDSIVKHSRAKSLKSVHYLYNISFLNTREVYKQIIFNFEVLDDCNMMVQFMLYRLAYCKVDKSRGISQKDILAGGVPRHMSLSPDNKLLIMSDHSIAVVNLENNAVLANKSAPIVDISIKNNEKRMFGAYFLSDCRNIIYNYAQSIFLWNIYTNENQTLICYGTTENGDKENSENKANLKSRIRSLKFVGKKKKRFPEIYKEKHNTSRINEFDVDYNHYLYHQDSAHIVEVYNIHTNELVSSIKGGFNKVVFCKDGRHIIFSSERSYQIYDYLKNEFVETKQNWGFHSNCIKISPDSRYLSHIHKSIVSTSGATILDIYNPQNECYLATDNKSSNSAFNKDGTKIYVGDNDEISVFYINYDYEFPGWADWDEGARPYLDIFLTLHPNFTDEDFDSLIVDLQNKGYGWIRPAGVRKELEKMADKR